MLFKKPDYIRSSEITPKDLYLNRRKFLAGAAVLGTAAATGVGVRELLAPSARAYAGEQISGIQKSPFSTTEKITPMKDVTHYNNYYEFSTEKEEPAQLAKDFRTRPWKVTIDGAVKNKQVLDVDSIIKFAPPEERIYRHRCVEGWSIVVPWKYGFKSAKAIVRIHFADSQPVNTWSKSAPSEYGFYSNVNPNVDHPRWSQKTERRLGEFFKRPTLMFNGYDQVASLYSGMDLKKNF